MKCAPSNARRWSYSTVALPTNNVIVLDVNQGAWKLETERGVIMDGDKAEHLLEAIPVMGSYCDIIGVRAFAGLKDRDEDYRGSYSTVALPTNSGASSYPRG